MKTFNALLVILCAAFMNCTVPAGELNYPDPNYFPAILGKWYPVETLRKGVVFPYGGHEDCGRDFIEFQRSNKINSINILNCEEKTDYSGTFGITGYKLTISYNRAEEYYMQISKLDSVSMELIFTDDLDGDGIDEEIRIYSRE